MSQSARRAIPLALVLGALSVATGSIATSFACVPMAKLVSLEPGSSGPAGSRIVVNGLAFGESRVELRWDAPDGRLLASARGPDFSSKVRIPKVSPGLYTLIVLERQEDGSIGNTASAAFDVIPRGGASDGARRGVAAADDPGSGSSPVPSADLSWPAFVAGGSALVLLGALGGALLGRRRRRKA